MKPSPPAGLPDDAFPVRLPPEEPPPRMLFLVFVVPVLFVSGLGKLDTAVRVAGIALAPLAAKLVSIAVRAMRRRRGRRLRPEAPWTWDRRWNPEGETRSVAGAAWGQIGFGVALFGVCAYAGGAAVEFRSGVVGFVVLALAICGLWFVWTGWRELRRGALTLELPSFPCFVGERFRPRLCVADGGATFLETKVELRCLRAVPEDRTRVWCVWSDTYTVSRDYLPGPGDALPLDFELPADAAGTRLGDRDATYWEVRVVGRTDSGPVSERYLVPLYERPVAVTDEAPSVP